jgi:hypothetical protein
MMTVWSACHIHSSWSYDGRWSLKEIAAEFARRGFRVVMITEHDRGFTEERRLMHREACAEASTSAMLIIPGIEYSDAANNVHVLVWGSVPFLGEGVPTAELLRAVKASRGISVLAHPSRRGAWRLFEPEWAQYLDGIELWNRKTDGWAPSRHAPLLLKRYSAHPFVGMDFHDRRQLFPLGMRIMTSEPITEESMLANVKAGTYIPIAYGIELDTVFRSGANLVLSTAEVGRRAAAWTYRRLNGPNGIGATDR